MGSLNFIISMFYRVSTAVISPALVRDLGLTGPQLSDLSAAFFYAFALSQIPIGMALDRLGPRITTAVLAVAAVGGAVVFAMGDTTGHLILGRVLLGIGMSGNLMVVLALLAEWFPVDRFAFLGGVVVSVGALGNLLASTPLALLVLSIGWRESFFVFAVVNAAVVTGFVLVTRDHPPGHSSPVLNPSSLAGGLRQLFRMYSYWAISLTSFVRYGYFAALQSLWVGPFLMSGLGLGEITASYAIFAMGLGYMVGLPLSGSISDKTLRSRKKVALPTMMAFCALTLSVVLWTASVPLWLVLATFFGLGVTAAPGQILYAHIKELLPPSMIARALTAVNLFTVLGAGIMTHVLGIAMGGEPASLSGPADFEALWYVGGAALAVVCVLYSRVPDTRVPK